MANTAAPSFSLESGDRLTRTEFHRRYCARPDLKRAELLNGVVYVSSPVSAQHGEPDNIAGMWLGVYAARVPDLCVLNNATLMLSDTSEVQPDVMLFREQGASGGAQVRDDGYVWGIPQLVLEIAVSSASYDLHDKLRVYEQAGVPEYVVWRVIDQAIDWFRLESGAYARVAPDTDGIIESTEFPGLRLSVYAMLAGNRAAVLAALDTPGRETTGI